MTIMNDEIGEMFECLRALLWSYPSICLDSLWVPKPKADNCKQDQSWCNSNDHL